MIILIVFILFTLYFFYVYQWVQHCLSKEYNFGSPLPPRPLPPHSPTLSTLFGILWGLTIVAGIFWGFYGNPYSGMLAWHSTVNNLDLFLTMAIVPAVALSYFIIYRLGELARAKECRKRSRQ